jgi:hypothetical protein
MNVLTVRVEIPEPRYDLSFRQRFVAALPRALPKLLCCLKKWHGSPSGYTISSG